MTQIVMTGDTVRVRGTFRDYAPEGTTGSLVDPDGQDVVVAIYDADLNILEDELPATRTSLGVYYYDWTPTVDGTYYVEIKGLVTTEPQLSREKFKVKFKPVEA